MAAGLFELRKDPITGWWVATSSTAPSTATGSRAPPSRSTTTSSAAPTARRRTATGSACGCSRTSRSTSSGPARTPASSTAGSPRSRSPRRARRAAGARSSRRPASIGALHAVGNEMIEAMVAAARDALAEARATGQTDYLQVVQNWGAQAGARTNHLCLDLYDLPQIPHRIAEELGGAARFVIREGECPFCRLVRDESRRPERLVWEDAASVAFAPYASRSPFEVWIVPRRHEADFGRATQPDVAATAEALRQVLARLADEPRRPALQPRPPHGAAARAGRRHVPLALGDPPAPARDRRPRARHRPAGQPGLAGGRRRGTPRSRRARRGRHRLEVASARPGCGVTPAEGPPSLGRRACAARWTALPADHPARSTRGRRSHSRRPSRSARPLRACSDREPAP